MALQSIFDTCPGLLEPELLIWPKLDKLTRHIFGATRGRLNHSMTVGASRHIYFSPVTCSDGIMG